MQEKIIPKLILSDLDHTLLRSDGTISENTLNVLRRCKDKGIRTAIATARYWIGAEKYIDLIRPDYEITTDGTLVNSDGKCVYSCQFTVEDTNGLITELRKRVSGAEITVASGKTVYWNSRHISESEKLYKAVYCDYDTILECKANKIVAQLPDESIAEDIAWKFKCKLQSYRGENWYAFLPQGAGKTAAIKALSNSTGISPEDVVAFGDDLNDMEMLKMCGTGVAVANAVREVLETADYVTLSNNEDGVAAWLEENVL